MKKLFLLITILSSVHASGAVGDVFAQCVTELPTTSFFIETVQDEVKVTVIHHNGLQYAPFWSNFVVPNDFNLLKDRADLVLKLAPQMSAIWKKADCKIIDGKKFVCMGQAKKMNVNGIEVEPWAVYSSQHSESSFAGDFEHTEVAMRFYIDQKAHEFVMKYSPAECLVSAKRILK